LWKYNFILTIGSAQTLPLFQLKYYNFWWLCLFWNSVIQNISFMSAQVFLVISYALDFNNLSFFQLQYFWWFGMLWVPYYKFHRYWSANISLLLSYEHHWSRGRSRVSRLPWQHADVSNCKLMVPFVPVIIIKMTKGKSFCIVCVFVCQQLHNIMNM
jgi:hypothetical protein